MEKDFLMQEINKLKLDQEASSLIVDNSYHIKENELKCYNMRELAKRLDEIRKAFPYSDDLIKQNFFFNIHIFFFKRISKEKTIIFLNVNNHQFLIHYEFIFLSKDSKKRQRRELPGNLVEEIVEKFQPLKKMKFYSDNLNYSGNYTLKHLINDCKNYSLVDLELRNYLICVYGDASGEFLKTDSYNINSDNYISNLQKNENFNFIKKISGIRAENISLAFKFNKGEELNMNSEKTNVNVNSFNNKNYHLNNLFFVFQNLITTHIRNLNLTFYMDDYLDLDSKIYEEQFHKINNSFKNKSEIDLINFKVTLINTNFNSKRILYTEKEFYLLPKLILYSLTPEFLEFNYIEIMNSLNSNLEKDVVIFKFTKVIYTKRFYCILNSLKNLFKYSTNNLNHRSNIKILKTISNFLNLTEEEIFETKTHHLRIMLNLDKIKSQTKFMFNLVEDYLSILERKIKYEEIFQMITSKSVDNGEESRENPVKNVIKLRPYDLNTVSKILSKIQANNFLVLKDYRIISIGGKFIKVIKDVEYSIALNTIIEINKNFSRMRVYSYDDNHFLSSFNSAAEIYDEENIIQVGGLSVKELLPNFAYTPIYKINVKSFKIERILPRNDSFLPGVIFNHKLSVSHDKNFLKVSEGSVIKNYTGGLNVMNVANNKQPDIKIEDNVNIYVFDMTKKLWSSISLSHYKK